VIDPLATDKILQQVVGEQEQHSLTAWAAYYYQVHVKGAPEKTEAAKQKDLTKFLNFFQAEVGHDHIDSWTPAITKQFQKLLRTISLKTQKPYMATSINRVMATIRHFGRWLHKQCPSLANDPLANVKDLTADAPDWNGLPPRQLTRL